MECLQREASTLIAQKRMCTASMRTRILTTCLSCFLISRSSLDVATSKSLASNMLRLPFAEVIPDRSRMCTTVYNPSGFSLAI